MRKFGVDEWIIQFVHAMYSEVRSKVSIENYFNDSACWSALGLCPQSTLFHYGFLRQSQWSLQMVAHGNCCMVTIR